MGLNESQQLPSYIDNYLCQNRELCLKLSLSKTHIELQPYKCYFMVTLYNGYTEVNQTLFDNWDDAIETFKRYCREAFEIELKK